MAQTSDRIRIITGFPSTNIIGYKTVIATIVHTMLPLLDKVTIVDTGWGHDMISDPVAPHTLRTILTVEFTTPKNFVSDAQAITVGNALATALAQPLFSVDRAAVELIL